MGFYATTLEHPKPHQQQTECASKTASRKIFSSNRKHVYQIERNPLNLQQEKLPTTYKTASGRPYWPSRDPIGEEGGINLYAFVENEPIGRWDKLGLVEVVGSVPKLKDVPVFWVNKPRIQNPGFTFAKGDVGCYCVRDEKTGKLKISCFLTSEIIISLNAGAKLKEKDIVGKPETWKRVFGHEVLHAKEIIRRMNKVISDLKAEPENPVSIERAAKLSTKYKELIKKAIEEGKKEDPKGNPKDPRPVSGKGYNPPKGSPLLPPNPFEK